MRGSSDRDWATGRSRLAVGNCAVSRVDVVQGVSQPANERVGRQRRSVLVVDVEESRNLREIHPWHPLRAIGDHGNGVRAQRMQAFERVTVVGDVPGDEVDRTDRQEFLDP